MGTVLEFNGIKIRVNPREHSPPHIHVVGNGGSARFNLQSSVDGVDRKSRIQSLRLKSDRGNY